MGTSLKTNSLIYPYFVTAGTNKKEEIRYFPGVFRYSLDWLIRDIEIIGKLGLNKILLFGVGQRKDIFGSSAYKKNNIVAQAVEKIKTIFPELEVFTDICLCAYTSHGHCGILKAQNVKRKTQNEPIIDNQETIKALVKIALSYAQAGADWVAPSAMAKRQVLAIRQALDKSGYPKVKILGYSAKFASNFYGPFRNAANSSPKLGDRSGYQLEYTDAQKALAEIRDDINEGSDAVMVKPALANLDIIKEARQKFNKTLVAYNVSGEYALVKYGAKKGLFDEKKMVREILFSIKRAGADYIISYHAKEVAKWLKEKSF